MKCLAISHVSRLQNKGFSAHDIGEIDDCCDKCLTAGFDWAALIDALIAGGVAIWQILKPILFPVKPPAPPNPAP